VRAGLHTSEYEMISSNFALYGIAIHIGADIHTLGAKKSSRGPSMWTLTSLRRNRPSPSARPYSKLYQLPRRPNGPAT